MTAPVPAYVYKATLHRMVDADTYWLNLDCGMFAGAVLTFPVYIRLHGFDAIERSDPRSPDAVRFTEQLLTSTQVVVKTYKQPSFARTVADVWCDGVHLGDLLRDAGYEKEPS